MTRPPPAAAAPRLRATSHELQVYEAARYRYIYRRAAALRQSKGDEYYAEGLNYEVGGAISAMNQAPTGDESCTSRRLSITNRLHHEVGAISEFYVPW